ETSIIDRLDVVVIPGGPDIPPAYYGQEPHPKTEVEQNGLRDAFEKSLIEAAMQVGKPIFSICRGFQLVNALLGGSLHQHLPELESDVLHRSNKSPRELVHPVKTVGAFAEVFGEEIRVNSWHHQGIDKLAPSLQPLAIASDGIVEAFESLPSEAPIFGIQWHPEILLDENSFKVGRYFIEKFVKKIGGGMNNG